jgi:hypothetical protein
MLTSLPRQRFITFLLFALVLCIFVGIGYVATLDWRASKTNLLTGNTTSDFYTELKNRFIDIATTSGASEALLRIEEESKSNNQTAALCHDILHEIGKVAFSQHETLTEAMQLKTDFCNSGYIHGLFEAYFESSSSSVTALKNVCTQYASTGSQFQLWQCHHGIGHGLMYFTDGDLPQSLSLCEDAVEYSFIPDCQNGVLMEAFNGEFLPYEDTYIDPQNPFAICDTYSYLKPTCYMYAPTYLSENQQMPYDDILKQCDQIDPAYRNDCITGVMNEATKRNMNDLTIVYSLCTNMDNKDDTEKCFRSVVNMYLNQTGSIDSGYALCLQVPKKYSLTCLQTVTSNEAFFAENTAL